MNEILAQRLKKCRKEAGLSQWEMAVYCDITERAYQNYERMVRLPRIDILVRMADQLHVSLDYLTGRTDDPAIGQKNLADK